MDAEKIFDEKKPDHKILNAALQLQEENPENSVILVTKDVNLRLKAKALNLLAEDYKTGKIKNVKNRWRRFSTLKLRTRGNGERSFVIQGETNLIIR